MDRAPGRRRLGPPGAGAAGATPTGQPARGTPLELPYPYSKAVAAMEGKWKVGLQLAATALHRVGRAKTAQKPKTNKARMQMHL